MDTPTCIIIYCDVHPFQIKTLSTVWDHYKKICTVCVDHAEKCNDEDDHLHVTLWNAFDDVHGLTGMEVANRAYAALRILAKLQLMNPDCSRVCRDVPNADGYIKNGDYRVALSPKNRLLTLCAHINAMMMTGLLLPDAKFACEYAWFIAGKRVK